MRILRNPTPSVSIIAASRRTARLARPTLGLVTLLLVLAASASAQTAPPSPPCQAEEHRQFDFWVGEWEVETADGNTAGTNRVEKILNGCVLLENWQGTGGSIGKSFNMYFGRDKTWRQTWVDGNGGRLDLSGGLDGSEMVLGGKMPGAQGSPVMHEIRWTPLADGRVKQHWRVLRAGQEEWQDLFVGFYSKKTQPPAAGEENERESSR